MSLEVATTPTEYAHIVRTLGIVGGEPRIANTRIRVRDIMLARDTQGLTPEEIVATVYPHLSLAQIYAALAYYEDHRAEIAEFQNREQELLDVLLKNPQPFLQVKTEK